MLPFLVLYQVEVLQGADHILHLNGCHLTQLLQADGALIILQHLHQDQHNNLYIHLLCTYIRYT